MKDMPAKSADSAAQTPDYSLTVVTEQGEQLTDFAWKILLWEEQVWRRPGAKAAAIGRSFGLTEIQYYQLLTRLLDLPAAAAESPLVVARLRRLRTAKIGHLDKPLS